jgi:outer membrane biogenesis lipoprotein LolB
MKLSLVLLFLSILLLNACTVTWHHRHHEPEPVHHGEEGGHR